MAVQSAQDYLLMAARFLAMVNGDPLTAVERKQSPPSWSSIAITGAQANLQMAQAVYEINGA